MDLARLTRHIQLDAINYLHRDIIFNQPENTGLEHVFTAHNFFMLLKPEAAVFVDYRKFNLIAVHVQTHKTG